MSTSARRVRVTSFFDSAADERRQLERSARAVHDAHAEGDVGLDLALHVEGLPGELTGLPADEPGRIWIQHCHLPGPEILDLQPRIAKLPTILLGPEVD